MSVIDSLIDQRDAFMRELVQSKQALDAKDARIKELEGALRECADDLEAELTHRYDGMLNHPVMKRRYDSDMSTVTRAREALK